MFSKDWAHSSTAVMHLQCITNLPRYNILDPLQRHRP